MSDEIWVDVLGYDGRYKVSNLGRVWSVPRIVQHRGGIRKVGGKYIKHDHSQKYIAVYLTKNGICSLCSLHRVILESFTKIKPKGIVCRHLDGNRRNNVLSNLAWGTYADNEADKIRHGTNNRPEGENHPYSKLTHKKISKMRRMHATGRFSQKYIGDKFGVSQSVVSCAIRGKSYKVKVHDIRAVESTC